MEDTKVYVKVHPAPPPPPPPPKKKKKKKKKHAKLAKHIHKDYPLFQVLSCYSVETANIFIRAIIKSE